MKLRHCTAILLLWTAACFAEVNSIEGFKNASESKYDYSKSNIRIVSPNGKLTAVSENEPEYVVIVDIQNTEVFRFKWDDLKGYFSWSDNVVLKGWSSDSRYFWFLSWTPMNIAYIARVDVSGRMATFYESPRLDETISDYSLDYDSGILIYSYFHAPLDEESRMSAESTWYDYYQYNIPRHTIDWVGKKTGKDILRGNKK